MCADGPQQGEPASSSTPKPLTFTTVVPPAHTRFGPIQRFPEIDSTNRYLLDEARAGASEGLVAVADYQRAGRGRLGRRWEAPPGSNLLMSVLLRPTLEVDELHLCTVAVALAAAAACERGEGVTAKLKWPNDLMVGGRKLGGILAEALPAGPGWAGAAGGAHGRASTETRGNGPAVIVGLGLNVRWPPPDTVATPDTPDTPDTAEHADLLMAATSIWREAGTAPEPLTLLGLLLEELEGRLVELADDEGRRRLTAEYRRRCDTVGKTVRVTLPGEVFTGTAADITDEGHLLVDVGVCLRTVAAGDVVHLRDRE